MVDFGTAITFDAVSAEGEYLGGVIGPGIEISMEALTERAAKLPKVDLAEPESVIGKSTAGQRCSRGSSTDSPARSTRSRGGSRPSSAARSSSSPPAASRARSCPSARRSSEVDDLLTLTGLRLIYERNAYQPDTSNAGSRLRLRGRLGRMAMQARPGLTDPFSIGGVEIANRVLLAPLAGIGNWFVRLQARRHGAGLAVSEMVSSFGIHYRNERTLRELLQIHPEEHPVSIQLFGQDPEVMRSAAATVAEAGADLIDINMGCPVRKVCKTGAGAALLRDPELALAWPAARGARAGGGAGDREAALRRRPGRPLRLRARRAAGRGGGGRGDRLPPPRRQRHHKGSPDYALTRELVERLDAPVIVSGGLATAEAARRAYAESGAAAVMIARGALGNPWIFEELTGRRDAAPHRER